MIENVSFGIAGGEIVALAGSNGAGKSTVVKILSGLVQPDSGSIYIGDAPVTLPSASAARALAIGVVQQNPGMIPGLSVLENFAVRRGFSGRNGPIRWKPEREALQRTLALFDIRLPFDTPIGDLPLHEQQLVAVAGEVSKNARLLILDEVTALLSDHEVRHLFTVLARLRSSDVAVLMVTHRMKEVFEISDRVVVLRDGVIAADEPTQGLREERLATLITGREIAAMPNMDHPSNDSKAANVRPALRISNLRDGKRLRGVSFSVAAGEAVGLAGLAGSGQSETLEAIFGTRSVVAGEIEIAGKRVDLRTSNARRSIRHSVGYVPKDRSREAMLPALCVGENVSLPWLERQPIRSALGYVSEGAEHGIIGSVIKELNVACRGFNDSILSLSGGNQQKLIVGRWLLFPMQILLLDEPTQGVDIQTKREIYGIIRKLTAAGTSVLVSSSEFEEFQHMCERVLIFESGRVSDVMAGNADPDVIYSAAYRTASQVPAGVIE
ncbi:MAG: sugar ABC transporter ATP-binding protein [Candidatus Velthaea sp.]